MQWIDALGYEEVMTFLRSTPANLFFSRIRNAVIFLFRTLGLSSPTEKGRKRMCWARQIWRSGATRNRPAFIMSRTRRCLPPARNQLYHRGAPGGWDGILSDQKRTPLCWRERSSASWGLIGDITERVRLEKQAQNWAIHDELTGLYNRNYLKVKGAEQLKGAIMPITIIMGDCKYLKRVNDAYGHEYGDLLLKRVGRVIRENLPPESVALRMGGDEFLIACSHFSAEEAEQLIERLHGELARQSDDRLKLDVAFGYHTVTEGPFDYVAVYHAADRDMYRNKRKNR